MFAVPAQFTSLISYFKYAETYGLSAHQAAALVIARRAQGFAEKVPKELVSSKILPMKTDPRVTGPKGRACGGPFSAK